MKKKDEQMEALKSKRNELIDRLDQIKKDYKQGLDADSEERAVQLENAEVLEGIAQATRDELDRIERELAEYP